LIAATAALHPGVDVLTLDDDFDRLAEVLPFERARFMPQQVT
jgi:hypothetical protein